MDIDDQRMERDVPLPTTPTNDFLLGLPKAELHLHVEGTLEPDLKLRLARRNGVDIGQQSVEDVQATYQFTDLASFLAVYYPAMQVLVTEQDFYDLADAYLAKAATQGVKRAEIFFDPQAHTTRGISFATVISGYSRAAYEAAERHGIDAELIMCFLRDHTPESAHATLEEALPHKHRILGVGLDSDERGNPPALFAKTFATARENGLKLTMHCDIDQHNSIEHIRQVIEDIAVDRIDHGTNIVEDPALVKMVRDQSLGLTCCPLSNSFVSDDMKANEIINLLREGVKVTLNSDDPAYFGGYIGDNYQAFAQASGATTEEMVQIARNSFDVSWVSAERRADYHAMIDSYVQEFSA